jgi:hypothetical protein
MRIRACPLFCPSGQDQKGFIGGTLAPPARGWLALLYRRLCAYAHSQAGFNNADFWKSNGPVYRPRADTLILDELQETVEICCVISR